MSKNASGFKLGEVADDRKLVVENLRTFTMRNKYLLKTDQVSRFFTCCLLYELSIGQGCTELKRQTCRNCHDDE